MRQDTELRPVRQIAAHELVLEQMRRAIEAGQFRPGDRLPSERDMADQLDVSRTTVRAAVSTLEREGLVTVKRGRGGGFIVQSPKQDPETARFMLLRNRQEIQDSFEYRALVESAAARLAAVRRTETEIITLRAMLQSMGVSLDKCLAEQDARHVAEFLAIDSAFHMAIADASRNRHLTEAVRESRRRMWNPVGSLFGRLEENANDFHAEILEAIAGKDGLGAEELMDQHVLDTKSTLEKFLRR